MKTTKILLVLLILAVACYAKSTITHSISVIQVFVTGRSVIKIIQIDKCEYILGEIDDIRAGVTIIHKQNCSNCKPLKK